MNGESRPGLRASREGGVLTIVLDRPERRNALTTEIRAGLRHLVSEAARDGSIYGLLLCGSPGIAFAAGADLTEIQALTPDRAAGFGREGQELHEAIARAPFASVAAIDGYCYGGGLDLALSCDLRIATPRSRFRHPGSRLGILTGWGGTRRVPRLLGRGRGARFLLLGDEMDADEALRVGLLDRLVPPGELVPACRAILSGLAERVRPGFHREILDAVERTEGLGRAAGIARERAIVRLLLSSA